MPQVGETRPYKNSVYRFDGRQWTKVGPSQAAPEQAAAAAPAQASSPEEIRIGPTTPPKEKPVARGQVQDPLDPTRMLEVDLNRYQAGSSLGDTGVFGVAAKLPGTYTPKDVNTAKLKINTLALAKAQLQNVRDQFSKIKNTTMAGPESGLYPSGFREDASNFDASVDALRNTIASITRIPGIGAMSDYEQRLANAQLPSRYRRESSIDLIINSLQGLIDSTESGYADILSGAGVDYSPRSITPASQMGEMGQQRQTEVDRAKAARIELERRRAARQQQR